MRFTPRPEASGSGVEAIFRFLESGVDFRGKKGRKGSEGREVGSGARIEIEKESSLRLGELGKPWLAGAAVGKGNGLDGGCCIFFVQQPNTA